MRCTDFINLITINNLVRSTYLSKYEILKNIKDLEIKGYIAVLAGKIETEINFI